jgi:hypothetical protein
MKRTIFVLLMLLASATFAKAQVSVTFKVNLKPQLEDSIYVPGRDQIYLKGNRFPLTNSKKVFMQDAPPADSVFEATVEFPATASGKKLQYNYFILTPEKLLKEHLPRHLQLRKGETELDALYFDSFAW